MLAARLGDMHVCPAFTGPVTHVGGPIALGFPTVLVGMMPSARVCDMATCVGPLGIVNKGSMKTLIGNMPPGRLGDMSGHGGSIVMGCPTVMIGG